MRLHKIILNAICLKQIKQYSNWIWRNENCFVHLLDSNVLLIFLVAFLQQQNSVSSSSDDQCCRKRIECFECDSRYNPGCNDAFNQTRENGNFVYCNDLCVKLRHKYENTFYYIRSCADQFKNVLIKKLRFAIRREKKTALICAFVVMIDAIRQHVKQHRHHLIYFLPLCFVVNVGLKVMLHVISW